MFIYVHNKCKLLCSLTERERAHVSSSDPGHRAANILGL